MIAKDDTNRRRLSGLMKHFVFAFLGRIFIDIVNAMRRAFDDLREELINAMEIFQVISDNWR